MVRKKRSEREGKEREKGKSTRKDKAGYEGKKNWGWVSKSRSWKERAASCEERKSKRATRTKWEGATRQAHANIQLLLSLFPPSEYEKMKSEFGEERDNGTKSRRRLRAS